VHSFVLRRAREWYSRLFNVQVWLSSFPRPSASPLSPRPFPLPPVFVPSTFPPPPCLSLCHPTFPRCHPEWSEGSWHALSTSSSSPIKSVPNSSRPPANFTPSPNSMTPSPGSGHSWPTIASRENVPLPSPTSAPWFWILPTLVHVHSEAGARRLNERYDEWLKLKSVVKQAFPPRQAAPASEPEK